MNKEEKPPVSSLHLALRNRSLARCHHLFPRVIALTTDRFWLEPSLGKLAWLIAMPTLNTVAPGKQQWRQPYSITHGSPRWSPSLSLETGTLVFCYFLGDQP